ncbi:hypothetical protein GCM10010218_31640 [Streptomyces mashuensis]|uniref:HTH cro/C1-type domain-containing protein n=1 Tax=Streptomyces mashuensis TaxID=33904 RepID=A0A919B3U2_9ACTN|nr:helix-turn-helix domain-containing protein [Streptomyces mashuensis]GHF47878.1 hypothetical protein GCM10010218_31640 [Streptomyces mashuensis]
MPRWKELPATLDPRVAQLVVQLRRLKDRSGLSLASLAAKTSYSASSWERYLNGRQLPSRDAVEEIARVCGTDATRLLVLHELAEEAWSSSRTEAGTAGLAGLPGPAGPPPAGPSPAPPRRRTGLLAGVAAAVLVVALAVGLLIARPWRDDGPKADGAEAGAGASASPSLFVFVQGRSRPCDVRRENGELRAGYSPTRTALMDLKSSGWEVLEAQCLLKHHGFDPGLTDGAYGERSKEAARRFQKDRGLVVDGIVGPDTWKELRK